MTSSANDVSENEEEEKVMVTSSSLSTAPKRRNQIQYSLLAK